MVPHAPTQPNPLTHPPVFLPCLPLSAMLPTYTCSRWYPIAPYASALAISHRVVCITIIALSARPSPLLPPLSK
jgi:hypothetical protein